MLKKFSEVWIMAYTNIDRPLDNFVVTTWSGNDVNGRTISNGEFQPDFLWMFHRNIAGSCPGVVYNSTIGAGTDSTAYGGNSTGKYNAVYTSLDYGLTGGDFYRYGYLSGLTSTGFTCAAGNDPSGYQNYRHNQTGYNYVAWQWKANGGTTSSNTDGNITSTVQANTDAGFSIVNYTGNGVQTGKTVGHGLGAVPKMIISKDMGSTSNVPTWRVYHEAIGATKYLQMPQTDAASTYEDWDNTTPTSSVYSVGGSGGYTPTNTNNIKYIAYVFADVQGYSKFGSYIGNGDGNGNGTFVYTGFAPSFILIKRIDAANDWIVHTYKLGTKAGTGSEKGFAGNLNNAALRANANSAVDDWGAIDMLSNGFKIRTDAASENANGGTYIYMAFAENPFVTSTGVPTTAR
jgi:hypothetical protein